MESGDQTPELRADEPVIPPLILPASREPWWVALGGLVACLAFLVLLWLGKGGDGMPPPPSFQRELVARANTSLTQMLQYHQARGDLPMPTQQTLAQLAARAATEWEQVGAEEAAGERAGLASVNAAALHGAAGNLQEAHRALKAAMHYDMERTDLYQALLLLYTTDPPLPDALPADVTALLSRSFAGGLVHARHAELRDDPDGAQAALAAGARMGWRIVAVNAVVLLGGACLLLAIVVVLALHHRRIGAMLAGTVHTRGPEAPWGVGTALIVVTISYITAYFLGRVLIGFAADASQEIRLLLNVLSMGLGPLLIVSLFLLALGHQPWHWGVLGWWRDSRSVGRGLMGMLLVLPLVYGATFLAQSLLPGGRETSPLIPELFHTQSALQIGIILFAVVVMAPLVEETLFRGVLFRAADARLPFLVAACGTGLLFAAWHQLLVALLPITLLGAFFALLTRRTQGLFAAATAHAVYNGIATILVLLASWALRTPVT